MTGPVYHAAFDQGSDAWLQARCGLLTASEMKLIVTPTLKMASNEREKSHLYELAAQRLTGYVEPRYISDDMLRGQEDEITARALYAKHYAPVTECGFITNDRWGFTLGYSPDGLVGDHGLIEGKSRRQKFQVETIIADTCPVDFIIQCQTGLLVSERQWLDFISFSGGMPLFVTRVHPDAAMQDAIIVAAEAFEARMQTALGTYADRLANMPQLIPTERTIYQEMIL